MIIRNLAATTLLAIVSCGIAAPALAEMPTSHLSQDGRLVSALRVSYSDLNLATAAGQATLAARISAATRAVCNNPESPRDESRCRVASRKDSAREFASVVDKANAPMLASR